VDDEAYIITGVTLTATNCAFQEAEAVVAVDGTITDTDCLFSVADFGFVDKPNGDFHLLTSSILRNVGYDTTPCADPDGITISGGVARDIGAYVYQDREGCGPDSVGMDLLGTRNDDLSNKILH